MMKRSGKFYRKNEADVMKALGLEPTVNSGSGWIEKEDGQSEDVICQLKSTDSTSIKLGQQDLQTLEYNASVCHKLPVFAVQFLNNGDVYLVMKPELLEELAMYLETGQLGESREMFFGIDTATGSDMTSMVAGNLVNKSDIVKSSAEARMEFADEWAKKWRKGKRSAL